MPSEHFNTVLYDGTGGSKDITNVGFAPDLTWVKSRGSIFSTDNHNIYDSIRGANYALFSDLTIAENYNTQRLQSFLTNGFTIGDQLNVSGGQYVAWNFKAGGAAVTNTDGTITSQVSANTEAGFSVVTYTGNGVSGSTVGHGLTEVPKMIIVKNRTSGSAQWSVYHSAYGATKHTLLNTTAAASTTGDWNNTEPTNSVITFNNGSRTNASVNNYIAYCFAEVEGFSNFGSYVGTGTSNTVVTGFEPAFVIIKAYTSADNWVMIDNKRGVDNRLYADLSNAEGTLANRITFAANGFTLTTSAYNASGFGFIYMAFAADPTAVEPTLEDSFNTVVYTGNGSTQNIGGVFEGGGSFNGSSSYISTSYIVPASTTASISSWFSTSSTGNYRTLFSDAPLNGAAVNTRMQIYFTPTNTFDVIIGNNSGYWIGSSNSIASYIDGNWHNLITTYNGTDVKVYIDGSLFQSFTSTISFGTVGNQSLVLGKAGLNNVNYWNGSIDQVRIFNTALTATQVTELYEETDADSHTLDFPSGAGSVALYELNGNANDTGGTYNGTATNVTWLNNGVGFQPDLVWFKNRDYTGGINHNLFDSIRGNARLVSSSTNPEVDLAPYDAGLLSFDSNGFTVGDLTNGDYGLNGQVGGTYGSSYVAWAWKGAEIPAINSNGSIPSIVSANPAAGFSIVTFTGNGQTGATVGHGLGTAPAVVINKGRANLATYNNWYVWHKDLPNPNTDLLILNNTDAAASDGNYFGGSPTDSTLIFGNDIYGPNVNGTTYVNYVFAEVAGFSKFGSYAGGSTGSGNVINTGFKPMFVMVKRTDIAGDAWQMFDSVRGGGDTFDNYVQANNSAAEVSYNQREINLTANGFYWTFAESGSNISGGTYIYMAFANQF